MSESNEASTRKVIVSRGQKKDFPMRWSKFQAYAGMKKVGKEITMLGEGLPAQADESIDKSKDSGK